MLIFAGVKNRNMDKTKFTTKELQDLGFNLIQEPVHEKLGAYTVYAELVNQEDYLNSPALVTNDVIIGEGLLLNSDQIWNVSLLGHEDKGVYCKSDILKFKEIYNV